MGGEEKAVMMLDATLNHRSEGENIVNLLKKNAVLESGYGLFLYICKKSAVQVAICSDFSRWGREWLATAADGDEKRYASVG